MTTFEQAQALLEATDNYWEVFTDADARAHKLTYRKLMKAVHPDRVPAHLRATATDLSSKLGALYRVAQASAGTATGGSRSADIVMTSRRGTHTVTADMSRYCDMTRGFRAASTLGGDTVDSFVKIARTPGDNDLLGQEAAVLKRLAQDSGDEFARFYPSLQDSFMLLHDKRRLRANAVGWMDGFYNLEELRLHRPDGLDPLDAAWVWRRMLWALGGAHDIGVLHAAVQPRNVIVHPVMHGVLLVDWCYSLQGMDGEFPPLTAVVGQHKAWYPPSILAGGTPDAWFDTAMAARTMAYLLGGDPVSMNMPRSVPALMQRYLIRITSGVNTSGAFELLAQFDGLLQDLGAPYYPRKYRELKL